MTDTKTPTFTAPPEISGNPNPKVPLAAVLRFTADKEVQTNVKVSDGEREWEIGFEDSHKPEDGLPILGMRANRQHSFQISIRDKDGNTTRGPETLEYITPPLPPGPREWPPIQVNVSKPDQMEPGITLFSVRRNTIGREFLDSKAQREFNTCWSLIVALDAEGEIIWYYQAGMRIAGFDYLQNGHLFYLTTDFRGVEIDMLGNKVGEWYAGRRPQGPAEDAVPVDVQTIHHQPHELPWGNFLVMTADSREIDGFYSSVTDPDAPRKKTKVMGDDIVEFSRDGSIVWNWNSFDHLDTNRIGYEALGPYWHVRGFPNHADWTHGNGLCYDEKDDAVLICLRGQDAIIKVDRKSGEVKWILGDHHGWSDQLQDKLLEPKGKVRWPSHMHNPKVTPEGTVLLWNNAIIQALPFDGKKKLMPHECFSQAIEYAVDEENMTVSEVWTSEEGPGEDSVCCYAMGDVHWMSQTGNVLVFYGVCVAKRDDMNWDFGDIRCWASFPGWTRVREYRHTDPSEVVFEVVIADPQDILMWMTFGGMKVPGLYPAKG